MFKTLTLLPLLFGAAIAIPSPTSDLIPRACTTVPPTAIDIIFQGGNNIGEQFTLDREGNPLNNTVISAITFTGIPEGATGCLFQLLIPALANPIEIARGDTLTEFWTTEPWDLTAPPPTWDNPPVKEAMVGTYTFSTTATTEPSIVRIESNVCSPTMSFLAQLSAQNGRGWVNFFPTLDGQPIGFELVYNC